MMKQQQGAALPEFAIVALLFFTVLFGAIETGRWMFTWNTLVEATRRGARIAAVCPPFDNYIKVATVFGNPNLPDNAQNSPVLSGLSTGDVAITYYKITVDASDPTKGDYKSNAFDEASGPIPVAELPNIQLVEVSINHSSNFIAPIIGDILGIINAPIFSTLMPIESMGDRQKAPNHCF